MTDDGDGTDADLEQAVEGFLRDARRVYEKYEEGYVDPDAALWTLEGHLDSLEDALAERDDTDRPG